MTTFSFKRYLGFIKKQPLGFLAVPAIGGNTLISDHVKGILLGQSPEILRVLGMFCNSKFFCTSVRTQGLSWEASSQVVLSKKLESALKDRRIDEAWETFKDIRNIYGFPNHLILNRFVRELSYSSDLHWLHKACDLVRLTSKQNLGLLHSDVLTTLSLSLARAQLPESASKILRLLLERENTPPMDVLGMVVMHMVKTKIGACLASNYLVQVCERFLYLSEKKNSLAHLMKLDTLMFNLVLDACVRFGFSLKGQELIEMMARTGVVADAHTIVIISHIFEMNGLLDEMKKFKEHIDRVIMGPFVCHYHKFYDNLLSLHFKFDDIDSAGQLVLDMCKDRESILAQKLGSDVQKPRVVPIGSHHIRSGLKIQIAPELLNKDSLLGIEAKTELVTFRNGKLAATNKAFAKIVYGYKRHGKICKLSKVLLLSGGSSLCADFFHACVNLGWLETAHDILDDMESAGNTLGLDTYKRLLLGYYKQKMVRNAEGLLRQMNKAGLTTNLPDEIAVSETEDKSTKDIDLSEILVIEMNEEKKKLHVLYELNSSVYYFCKAKMKEDALRTFRKMQEMKIQPTLQTFSFMIDMYSSLHMYREIAILWGNIKRNMETRSLRVSRDLLEKLVMNLIRGGYFERVIEIIGYMDQNGMYIDTSMYKSEFLKLHKNLYRSLRVLDARTEAQAKRIEHVREFRKLVGVH